MAPDKRHKAVIQFVRRMLDVPAGYSKEELFELRNVIARDYPALINVVDDYIRIAEQSSTDLPLFSAKTPKSRNGAKPGEIHLFDLLRDRRVFASNHDLANFAVKILPDIKGHRFDKMSRGDIAARIVEYLESIDPSIRRELEASMRDAISAPTVKPSERKSFLSKWEKIIKGIEL